MILKMSVLSNLTVDSTQSQSKSQKGFEEEEKTIIALKFSSECISVRSLRNCIISPKEMMTSERKEKVLIIEISRKERFKRKKYKMP